jgi:hypothetical protein
MTEAEKLKRPDGSPTRQELPCMVNKSKKPVLIEDGL